MRKNIKKLPEDFKYLLWSYDFSRVNPDEDRDRIIINTINYGDWRHWQWIFKHYGVKEVKKIIENIPASEFRQRALRLVCLLLKIRKIKYASRGIKIRAEQNIS